MAHQLAWYAGRQDSDNSIIDPPGERYLCAPPGEVVGRTRYAARIGLLPWGSVEYDVVFFVDPVTRHVYAQPQPDCAATRELEWAWRRPLPRDFESARSFVRATFKMTQPKKTKKNLQPAITDEFLWNVWNEWLGWRAPLRRPPPIDIPADPGSVYANDGWLGIRDWMITPAKKRAAQGAKVAPVA
jgi:hypothetical protein